MRKILTIVGGAGALVAAGLVGSLLQKNSGAPEAPAAPVPSAATAPVVAPRPPAPVASLPPTRIPTTELPVILQPPPAPPVQTAPQVGPSVLGCGGNPQIRAEVATLLARQPVTNMAVDNSIGSSYPRLQGSNLHITAKFRCGGDGPANVSFELPSTAFVSASGNTRTQGIAVSFDGAAVQRGRECALITAAGPELNPVVTPRGVHEIRGTVAPRDAALLRERTCWVINFQ